MTVYAYFQPYGQHLFYSVRSYAVPSLNGWKLFGALLLGVKGLDLLVGLVVFGVGLEPLSIPFLILLGASLVFVCRNLIRNIVAGDSVWIAVRKQFPGAMNTGSFDHDDVAAFLKTNVALTLGTVAKVLERHGVETETLRQIVQNLHVTNIHTGGGGIIGAVFGGSGNSAVGQVRR